MMKYVLYNFMTFLTYSIGHDQVVIVAVVVVVVVE